MSARLPRLACSLGLLACGAVWVAVAPPAGRAAELPPPQMAFPGGAPGANLPIVRQAEYTVNARIRPLALFWIGRDNVGDARFTWREGPGDRRAFELLVGSDPARTPRQVNRWGFIAEALDGPRADVLGFMKGSAEESLDDATANAEADRHGPMSLFKAVRTTIAGNRAVSGTLTFQAPPSLTYRQLDTLLRLLPPAPEVTDRKVITLPSGAKVGFLTAMTSMMTQSVGPCRDGRVTGVAPVAYLYKQSLYDLTLEECRFTPELRTKAGVYPDVIDGRFEIRSREDGDTQGMHIAFGTAGDLRDVPVRIVFRPRWWMEAELLLDQASLK